MDFVIDRSKWRCGALPCTARGGIGKGVTKLLNDSGFMCCLGFVSLQCGLEPDAIRNKDNPTDLKGLKPAVFLDAGGRNLESLAIKINDDDELTQAVREKELTDLFTQHGHTLTFTGEPVISGANQ